MTSLLNINQCQFKVWKKITSKCFPWLAFTWTKYTIRDMSRLFSFMKSRPELPKSGQLFYARVHRQFNHCNLTCATRKQTLRSLSLSYQKKDGRAWPRPSFFWHDTNFSAESNSQKVGVVPKEGWARPSFFSYDNDKDLKVCFLVTCVNMTVG